MTDDTTPNKPRATRPWIIMYRTSLDEAGGTFLEDRDFASLAEAEDACRDLAVLHPATIYTPVKLGESFVAGPVTEVKVTKL